MDEEIIRTVASAAAGLIVRSMGTAAWRTVRDRWSRVLGRGRSDQEEAVSAQLDESARSMAATDPDHREQRASELEAKWSETMRVELRSDPELVEPVRSLVEGHPAASRSVSVNQAATVWNGTSIQSGRDTHLGGRPEVQ